MYLLLCVNWFGPVVTGIDYWSPISVGFRAAYYLFFSTVLTIFLHCLYSLSLLLIVYACMQYLR
ncbi:uncharacterized protein BDW43DRAFT_218506 [Aspergillus alliaceus]|uniref:uncharacterized protein n=1 Tax=Petromyces alliaceus TaxID=209559 RepID=UPI0012A4E587|nr:uncharacterized protein BDW43DRAFT_218506 [Aspergillus alliaceus]KAB8228339.1 hypothetical protein BDW43DRAFT_218506 [Aspergillus alliaceus]